MEGFGYTPSQDALADAMEAGAEVPLIGGLLGVGGNYARSPEGQTYTTAKEDFITAVLRKESGAVINADEFTREDRKYFPQKGDTPERIQQKAEARRRAIDGVIAESQGAYEQMFGAPPGAAPAAAGDVGSMSDDDLMKGLGLR